VRATPFYDYFLQNYDEKLKREHGHHYTPWQVVFFMVRCLDDLMRQKFNQPEGRLSALLLDPAAGTSTFLITAAQYVAEKFACHLFRPCQSVFVRVPLGNGRDRSLRAQKSEFKPQPKGRQKEGKSLGI